MPTHYQGTPQEITALDTFIKLTRATDSLLSRLSQHGTQGDLSPSQFGVLEALYHLGAMFQNELAAKILKSSGNLTMVIDNLEKRKLVRRVRDAEDRRKVQVLLTDEGRDLISHLLPGHVTAITAEMNSLTSEELNRLGELCKRLGKTSHA